MEMRVNMEDKRRYCFVITFKDVIDYANAHNLSLIDAYGDFHAFREHLEEKNKDFTIGIQVEDSTESTNFVFRLDKES